jgi:hypothetical protein
MKNVWGTYLSDDVGFILVNDPPGGESLCLDDVGLDIGVFSRIMLRVGVLHGYGNAIKLALEWSNLVARQLQSAVGEKSNGMSLEERA